MNKNDNNSTFKNNGIMNNSINGIDKNNKQKVKYHWARILLNFERKNNKKNEFVYKLNICPTGAWNENCINTIDIISGRNLKLIRSFIQQ